MVCWLGAVGCTTAGDKGTTTPTSSWESTTYPTSASTPTGTSTSTSTTTTPVDFALLEQVAAEWEPLADLELLTGERFDDENGCSVPRWWHLSPYFYNAQTALGQGVHMIDLSYPVDQVEASRPRSIDYHLDDDGHYVLAGLEWYFEPPDHQPLEVQPTLFGVPMDGLMEPHVPGLQSVHYDLHAWVYLTSPDNEFGYFNPFNEAMETPDFYYDYEPVLYDSLKFTYAPIASDLGYVEVGCVDEAGVRWVNDSMTGALDPFLPDTLFYDVNGAFLGTQWTVPESSTVDEAPTLFQQTFAGPDADGNYVLRAWAGERINPDGLFAAAHRFVSCDEPPTPPDCL